MGDEGRRSVRVGRSRAAGALLPVALVVALGLGACTQDEPGPEVTAPTFAPASPEPNASEPAPSGSATAEPSAEPTVAAPPLPELATQQTPEGAVAFTEWWFATLNYATATGDTAGLRAASDPGCEFCSNLARQVDDAYMEKGRMTGGQTTIQVSPPGALLERGINLAIFIDVKETAVLNRDGVEVQTFSANPSTAAVASVLLRGQGWAMGEVSQ